MDNSLGITIYPKTACTVLVKSSKRYSNVLLDGGSNSEILFKDQTLRPHIY